MKISIYFIMIGFPFVVAGIGYVTYVLPAHWKTRGKLIALGCLLLAASKGLVFEFLGGHCVAPELPEALIRGWNLANDTLYMLVLLSFVWWTHRGRAVLLPLLALAIAGWGEYEGRRTPDVREIRLSYANLPANLEGYRILQISDLHCSSAARGDRTRAVVDAANAAHADLICLTGDYVDGKVDYLKDELAPLKDLKARDGVWCVTGNHEFFLERHKWRQWYRENGFRFLINTCVHPQPHLALAGVNDWGGRKYGATPPNVRAAFAGAQPGDFRILLDHQPKRFRPNVVKGKFDLQLSGHTHGGIAPLLDRYVAHHNGGFVRGLSREGDAFLYVNSGAGMWAGFPMRFFVPSEITVFTLHRK